MVCSGEILETAAIMIADRAATRDSEDGEKTMRTVVGMFSLLVKKEITEAQGWKFMELVKMVRSENGEHRLDDYVDGAAYAALAGEAAERAAHA